MEIERNAKANNTFWSGLQWIKSLKQNYLAKSPFEKWSFVRGINISTARIIGCEFLRDGYKVRLRTWISTPIALHYLFLTMYTLYYFRNDPVRGLMATPPVGIIFPSLLQYVLIMVPSTRRKMKDLHNFAGDFIYANSDSTPKNYNICDRMAINLFSYSVKVVLLVLFSLYLIACVPLYNFVHASGETADYDNQMVIPIILPFIDPYTQQGFYINIANQIMICSLGVIAVPSIELLTCVMINNVSVAAAVIANKFTEFGESIKEEDQFSDEYTHKFRNMILQVMDFDRYVSHYANLFYWKSLMQPLLLMYAIILCIYLYILRAVGACIGCSFCCYLQLLILCDAGKTVDDASNSILDALNQFPFYVLPTDKQKIFALLLKRNQNEAKLRIGPFAELNYETASKLTKTIYTCTMCLLKGMG